VLVRLFAELLLDSIPLLPRPESAATLQGFANQYHGVREAAVARRDVPIRNLPHHRIIAIA
jgi:hypothetical protein